MIKYCIPNFGFYANKSERCIGTMKQRGGKRKAILSEAFHLLFPGRYDRMKSDSVVGGLLST